MEAIFNHMKNGLEIHMWSMNPKYSSTCDGSKCHRSATIRMSFKRSTLKQFTQSCDAHFDEVVEDLSHLLYQQTQ